MSRYGSECKLYVGDLGNNASKPELEDAFSYYGPLRNVWVARNPPGFAFVEFEDPRDAEDAVRGLDGRTICGRRARVEMSNGKGGGRGYRGPPPRSSRMARPFHPDDRCYECGDRGHYARDCSRLGRRTRRRFMLGIPTVSVLSYWPVVASCSFSSLRRVFSKLSLYLSSSAALRVAT
ncbi:x16 splicing factor isoform X2 [Arctopsyche grandis]|uniref:x16 splicing factor isoform X2 n=1 Tax=Arctopsyche grandis TaxID=121162 RepID=UPI00406D75EB